MCVCVRESEVDAGSSRLRNGWDVGFRVREREREICGGGMIEALAE